MHPERQTATPVAERIVQFEGNRVVGIRHAMRTPSAIKGQKFREVRVWTWEVTKPLQRRSECVSLEIFDRRDMHGDLRPSTRDGTDDLSVQRGSRGGGKAGRVKPNARRAR